MKILVSVPILKGGKKQKNKNKMETQLDNEESPPNSYVIA